MTTSAAVSAALTSAITIHSWLQRSWRWQPSSSAWNGASGIRSATPTMATAMDVAARRSSSGGSSSTSATHGANHAACAATSIITVISASDVEAARRTASSSPAAEGSGDALGQGRDDPELHQAHVAGDGAQQQPHAGRGFAEMADDEGEQDEAGRHVDGEPGVVPERVAGQDGANLHAGGARWNAHDFQRITTGAVVLGGATPVSTRRDDLRLAVRGTIV